MSTVLNVENLSKSFGELKALSGACVELKRGAIVGLIGPNGAGKSTLFNIISGFLKPDAGHVYLHGKRIDGLSPDRLALMGLQRTFQIAKAPKKMTALETVLLADKGKIKESLWSIIFSYKKVLKKEENNLEKALSFLELAGIRDVGNEFASNLSGGQQKLLSLARILMSEADIVLLDEPTAGVNPTLIRKLLEVIRNSRVQAEKSFIIIEHNMDVISELCDEVYVLVAGSVLTNGKPEEIKKNKDVLEAYLGRGC